MTQPPSGPGPQGPDYGQQPGPYQGQLGQYPPGYGQPPQKKGKKKWVIGCLGLIVLAIVLFAGCGALLVGAEDATDTDTTPGTVSTGTSAPAEEEDETEPSAVQTEEVTDAGTVTLEATATTTGTVIWGDLDGSTNTEQFTGTWTKEIAPEDGALYHVTVTGDFMDENSEVTCQLSVDGELKEEATGTGSAGSASCTQPIFG